MPRSIGGRAFSEGEDYRGNYCLSSIHNIPDFGAKRELKGGVFLVLIGNLAIYFAAGNGQPE
jgi:hypothetical protein